MGNRPRFVYKVPHLFEGVSMPLLLMVVLLAQDASPEEILKKMEEKIATAKLVRVKFSLEGMRKKDKGEEKMSGTGMLILKEGNKLKFEMTMLWDEKKDMVDKKIISDGTRMDIDGRRENTPKNLNREIAVAFVRMGVQGMSVVGADRERDPAAGLSAVMSVSNLAAVEGEGGQSLSYTLKLVGEEPPISIKLWFVPDTFSLLKRRWEGSKGDTAIASTEIYEEFVFGGKVKDDEFALPLSTPKEPPAPPKKED
jgi:outer membrane lipoprotein-sorting protein